MKSRIEAYGFHDAVVLKEWAGHDTTMEYVYESEFDIRKRIGMLEDIYHRIAKK